MSRTSGDTYNALIGRSKSCSGHKQAALLTALVMLAICANPLLAADDGRQLLKSMQSAVHSLSYSGNLVFWKGNEMSEYHIEHQPGQGGQSETVIQLDVETGAANRSAQQFSLVNSSGLRLPDQQAYSIDLGQNNRIAGLPCKVVVIRPKDKMRYLYRYCIHADSGMLLKYSVMNRQQQLLEQFMFTQLNIQPNNRPQLQLESQGIATLVPDSADMNEPIMATLGQWDFSQLPAGFTIAEVRDIPGRRGAQQIILSDGLTFVSVFIEPAASANLGSRQLPDSGATSILSVTIADHKVTLVGEVPQETLTIIQNGLRYVGP